MFSTNEIMEAVGGAQQQPPRQPVGMSSGQAPVLGGQTPAPPQSLPGGGPNFDEMISRIQNEMETIAGRLQQDQMLVQMGDRSAAGRIGQMQMQLQTLQQRMTEAHQGKIKKQMESQMQLNQEQQMKQNYMNKSPMSGSISGFGGTSKPPMSGFNDRTYGGPAGSHTQGLTL